MPSHLPRASERPALMIGTNTVWLDSTLLGEVAATLGSASIVGDMDHSGWLVKACYSAGSGGQRATILLDAIGPPAEDSATLREGIATSRVWKAAVGRGNTALDSYSRSMSCAPVTVQPTEIRWWNGLRLGMGRAQVEGLLGPPKMNDEQGDSVHEYDDPRFYTTRVDPTTGSRKDASVYVKFSVHVRYDSDLVSRVEVRYLHHPNKVGR